MTYNLITVIKQFLLGIFIFHYWEFEFYSKLGSNRVSRTVYNAHDGGVFSICSMKDGTFLSGGGRDRRIVEWDHTLSRTGREAKVLLNFMSF